MNWNYVFLGLGLVAIGLTIVLAPWPPSWWPSMSKELVQATFAVGILILIVGIGFTAVGVSPVLKDKSLWPQTGMVVCFVGFIGFGIWAYVAPPNVPTNMPEAKPEK